MLVKIVCFVAIFGVVLASKTEEPFDKRIDLPSDFELTSPYFELPCMTFGGKCLPVEECPKGRLLSVKGLCPLQQKEGVECCH
ncbi:Carboxypeptidase inhibitor [Operophtera brumata]|uniref:Carboxypeptidase inhibitor n=1 Tax=Operophtera brumata TaxID=104452 RepID=A0A0L7K3M3_OPEBR|nr:Carboxypeptidase inhibitor [Operophtera brumata]KOB71267.1 Carboxypeptidase inhibitor [Operophtera brumata]